MSEASSRWQRFSNLVWEHPYQFLLVLCALAFGITVRFGFMYDDIWTIVENWFVHDLSNLGRFFSEEYFRRVPDNNRPVMILTTMIDYQINGMAPGGYHLHSVLWHGASTLLLYALVKAIWEDAALALCSAVVFAVHAIHVEPVASINYREDLLATAFSLATLLCLTKASARAKGGWWLSALGLLCFALAIYSKEAALATPGLLFAIHWIRQDTWQQVWRAKWQYTGLLAIGLTFIPFYQAFSRGYTSLQGRAALELSERLWTTGGIFLNYFGQFLLPIHTSPEYFVEPSGSEKLVNWLGWSVVALLIGAALWLRRKRPPLAAGLAWLLLAMVPIANFLPIFNMRADRYLYMPSVGYCLACGFVLHQLAQRYGIALPGKAAVVVSLVFAVPMLGLTYYHVGVWQSGNRMWERSLAYAPESRRAWEGAVLAWAKGGEAKRAVETANEGLKRYPGSAKLLMGRGIGRAETGNLEGAVEDFKAALKRMRGIDKGRLYNNLGVVYTRLDRHEDALEAYQSAVAIAPKMGLFLRHEGEALEALGRIDEAKAQYRKTLRIAPHEFRAAEALKALDTRNP